jgi:hypothetical protein
MAEEKKGSAAPITSGQRGYETIGSTQGGLAPGVAQPRAPEGASGARTAEEADAARRAAENGEGEEKVTVKALRNVHKAGNLQGEMAKPGDEFETTKSRASQLRANGIIEYANESDAHDIHGKRDHDAITERVKRDNAMRTESVEKNRTTPLRNPKLEYAEVSEKDDPRAQQQKDEQAARR